MKDDIEIIVCTLRQPVSLQTFTEITKLLVKEYGEGVFLKSTRNEECMKFYINKGKGK